MSQSRFSIVLVGVSALLRRPLVSRLRPADGERSPWVVFTARGDLPFRHLPLGGLTFGLTASAFRHAPLRSCRSAGWPSGSRLPLFGMRRFGVALGELVLPPSASEIAARRVGLRAHASGLPSASWFCRLPFRRLPLGGLAFGLTASAFRHAPLRRLSSASWPSGSPLPFFGTHRFGVAVRRVGLRAHRFRFSARTDPHRRTAETSTDGAHRHDNCFTSKHLSQHVNLPHRTP